MSKIEVLVGLPGSGKSTFVNNVFGADHKNVFIYSTDSVIEQVAADNGKTYNECFKDVIKQATLGMDSLLHDVVRNNLRVVWDQTNMASKKRRSILSKFPSSYRKVCWCIAPPRSTEEWNELNRRLDSRPGKTIPEYVIQSMVDSYIEPELDEGFDYILVVDLFGKTIAEKGTSI